MVEINDRKGFDTWLRKQPRDVSATITARAALRALPYLMSDLRGTRIANRSLTFILSLFRLHAVSWAASKYPAQGTDRIKAAITRADAAYAAAAAAFAADIDSTSADNVSADFSAAPWRAVTDDVNRIVRKTAVSQIIDAPMWPNADMPEFERSEWAELKSLLLARNENWKVWTDWYEARLRGGPVNDSLELARALIDDDIWDDGPATVNAHILDLMRERGTVLVPPPSQVEISYPIPLRRGFPVIDGFAGSSIQGDGDRLARPAIIDNLPAAYSFGWNAAGKIAVIAGPHNLPFLPHKGSEADHKQRLDTARSQARKLLADLKAGKYQVRAEYRDSLKRYIDDLPREPGSGNFMMADAEARFIRNLFKADSAILPTPFAARLKTLLECHTGARAYYPEIARLYSDIVSGALETPMPLDAVDDIVQVVEDNTPRNMDPSVKAALDRSSQSEPAIAPIPQADLPPPDDNAPVPPPDPLGEVDAAKARNAMFVGTVKELDKAISAGEKIGKSIESAEKFWSAVKPFYEWATKLFGNGDLPPPPISMI